MVVLAIYAFSPLLYDEKISENVNEINLKTRPAESSPALAKKADSIETLKQGEFVGVGGHEAKGTAKLLKSEDKYFLRL